MYRYSRYPNVDSRCDRVLKRLSMHHMSTAAQVKLLRDLVREYAPRIKLTHFDLMDVIRRPGDEWHRHVTWTVLRKGMPRHFPKDGIFFPLWTVAPLPSWEDMWWGYPQIPWGSMTLCSTHLIGSRERSGSCPDLWLATTNWKFDDIRERNCLRIDSAAFRLAEDVDLYEILRCHGTRLLNRTLVALDYLLNEESKQIDSEYQASLKRRKEFVELMG
jgi:hypothetical protein